jgi:hypothetical protein
VIDHLSLVKLSEGVNVREQTCVLCFGFLQTALKGGYLISAGGKLDDYKKRYQIKV